MDETRKSKNKIKKEVKELLRTCLRSWETREAKDGSAGSMGAVPER